MHLAEEVGAVVCSRAILKVSKLLGNVSYTTNFTDDEILEITLFQEILSFIGPMQPLHSDGVLVNTENNFEIFNN